MKSWGLLLLLIHISLLALSQVGDSIPAQKDSLKNKKSSTADTSYIKRRANRAAIYSAIVPGLGQAYNKKYWKIPILYGGAYGLYKAIKFNNEQYQKFRDDYKQRLDYLKVPSTGPPDEYINIYPDPNSLLVRRDYYRRSRDLMYIFTGVVYVLNIIDAYVDAHLANFDVSDKLTLNVSPSMQMTYTAQPLASLSLSFSFH